MNNEETKKQEIKGLNEEVIRKISEYKKEPEWMLNIRLKSLEAYKKTPIPNWGPDLSGLELERISYFVKPAVKQKRNWEEVPENIKETFEKLGIPEAERKALAGVGAQYDSEAVYHNIKKELAEQGVIFLDMDEAVKKQEELVKKNFMKVIPYSDHKFMMLHGAVWSGGTFIYVPKGVKVKQPLQAYFFMKTKSTGQFEHTLIILDEEAELHYIEGCSAPRYDESSLHAGAVEIIVGKKAKMRYTSIENWSSNTYNLNTKRAIVEEEGIIEWVGGNMGSGTTMLYPMSILKGNNSKAEHLSIAVASDGQNQDTGAKVVHIGKNTSSIITSKSISKGTGITTYRGLVKINKGAKNAKSHVECDSLLFGKKATSNTYPLIDVKEISAKTTHEARIGRIGEEQLYYLRSRGINEEEATKMIITGFINPVSKELPLEYAIEFNKLIELEMEGSVG